MEIAGQRVLCMECGDIQDAKTGFAPAQLRKKRPICRTCTGGSGAKFKSAPADGYASKVERARAQELLALERMGAIRRLRMQVPFELVPAQEGEKPVRYVADFVYEDDQDRTVVEDAKGFRTPTYVIKRKLMLWRHGIRIVEIRQKTEYRRRRK